MERKHHLFSIVVFSLAVPLTAFAGQAFAANGTLDVSGANKWHAISATSVVVPPGGSPGVPLFDKDPVTSGAQPLEVRMSTTGDLVIEVGAECAVIVSDFDPSIDSDHVLLNVKVHVEVDGVLVKLTPGDDGRVNFCDLRLDKTKAVVGLAADIETEFRDTGTTADFKWFKINVGNGIHTVQAFAKLDDVTAGTIVAAVGMVGKRSMTIFTTTTLQN